MPGGSGHVAAYGKNGRAAKDDGERHALAGFLVAAEVPRTVVVHVPVHGRELRLEKLHAVHADVAVAGLRVLGEHGAEGDVAAAIIGPAFQRRQREQVGVVGVHDFLADAAFDDLRRQAAKLCQLRQLLQLLQ